MEQNSASTSEPITVYAELHSNIAQISLVATLSTPSDSSTKITVLDRGQRLEISHKDDTKITSLPAAVHTSASLLPVKSGSLVLDLRLPVSATADRRQQAGSDEKALPWSATEIEPGSSICCRQCGLALVPDGVISSWKDLPSDNWAEMMEFWHCHKPHDHAHQDGDSLESRGYGASSSITAQPGAGLVDQTYFQVSEMDCSGLLVRYIPAGCIGIRQTQSTLSDEAWGSEDLRSWNWLDANDDTLAPASQNGSIHDNSRLRPDVQTSLLQASEFTQAPVNRVSSGFTSSRMMYVVNLDYSKDIWNGSRITPCTTKPFRFTDEENTEEEDLSLLQLFNRIPSPSPNPDVMRDRNYQDVMYDIMDSNIAGLKTELYPYQRRSIAVMLQKEAQPKQVLDPRLLHAQAQDDSSWYVDTVSGTVFLEPRYYDGISGGILAEEMGSGKTLICLALIQATRHLPTQPPELYSPGELPVRKRTGSLLDMAAACATRHAVPWKPYFEVYKTDYDYDFDRCIAAIERNPGCYLVPAPEPRRGGRHPSYHQEEPIRIYLSAASVIVVPNNLVAQWKQEIQKHTNGMDVVVIVGRDEIPDVATLRKCDIVLFSQTRFEAIVKQFGGLAETSLSLLHFKRCIVDEGHKLGHSKIGHKSNLLLGLDTLRFSSRWIVTGTPSRGLFGVATEEANNGPTDIQEHSKSDDTRSLNATSNTLEKEDLERIGAITSLYLKARPWANTTMESGDTTADWTTYLMLPKHNAKGRGRWDSLKSTLNSLIVRHRLAEIGELLPPVDEKVVVLEGSYQDRLSLNIFSMMIIFNSVQSQRTDMDYFFHQKQRKSLLQIVHNLKQSSFFGGSFFTSEEIATSVKTAEEFLMEGRVPISTEDEALLRSAIAFGQLAMNDSLRNLSNQFHEIPVSVIDFPGRSGSSWSLDGEPGDIVCTSASMLLVLQKLMYSAAKEPEELNSLLNGGLLQAGLAEKEKILAAESLENTASERKDSRSQTLAGNTRLGDDSPRKNRSHGVNGTKPDKSLTADCFSGPLELTRITSTTSAKLSYLIDGIIKYQDKEKIIVFYDNDNVAWYLASMLDVLQVQHLIYAKSLGTERRAQYVNTFHHNPIFRVLLMDITQAAFGLDMREASRIYFINPVLNPQVEAQAIGRVRRISQQKPVFVETLVLKDSIDEVILDRKKHMTQAEHRQVKSLLDVRPIYNWIKNANIIAMPAPEAQYALLQESQKVFGRGFGRTLDPDHGIVLADDASADTYHHNHDALGMMTTGLKRAHGEGPGNVDKDDRAAAEFQQSLPSHAPRKVRFAVEVTDG
ncbi:DNA repair protein rad8 [Paramyrothecium foliicola]|nr:DNA repair protein rad8 [Paramyrothecium foliicola]